ncbi:MAG: transferase [Thermotogaceae bacterium]|nr:transferase [Thermotogaceae bacterium]
MGDNMFAKTALIYSKTIGVDCEISDYSIIYENALLGRSVFVGEHAVIGREPRPTSAIVREIKKAGTTIIGDYCSVSAHAVIYSGVSIGPNTLIGDGSSIMPEVSIGEQVLISRNVSINSDVVIGSYTRIMDNSHITGRTRIGNHVFISVGVISANDNAFGGKGFCESVKGQIIEDYASIGVGVVLLPGVKLGFGCIVAAGSVVKKDVDPETIVAGNPAVFVSRVPKHLRRY